MFMIFLLNTTLYLPQNSKQQQQQHNFDLISEFIV